MRLAHRFISTCFVPACVAACAVACNGRTLDAGNPSAGSGGGGDAGSPPTFAGGSDWQAVPARADVHFTTLAGSSATDIWGTTAQNELYRFDGQTWNRVALTAPASTGDLTGHIASAGPGAVWIAHAYGVVRVDAIQGVINDFTAQVAPAADDVVLVDASADMTVVALPRRKQAFAFDGKAFVGLPAMDWVQTPTVTPNLVVQSKNGVWYVTDWDGGFFDGTVWHHLSFDGLVGGGATTPFSAGKLALFAQGGTVSPSWAHEGPPYGATSTSPWQGGIASWPAPNACAGSDGPACIKGESVSIDPPTDLDPAVAYVAMTAEPARSGKLALLGCAYRNGYMHVGGEVAVEAQWVVHEWSGQSGAGALEPRRLSSSPGCVPESPIGAPPGSSQRFWRPLTDGTWILPAGGNANAAAILMRP